MVGIQTDDPKHGNYCSDSLVILLAPCNLELPGTEICAFFEGRSASLRASVMLQTMQNILKEELDALGVMNQQD